MRPESGASVPGESVALVPGPEYKTRVCVGERLGGRGGGERGRGVLRCPCSLTAAASSARDDRRGMVDTYRQCQRPHHCERTGSRQLPAVKRSRVWLVPRSVTAWESQMPLALSFLAAPEPLRGGQ